MATRLKLWTMTQELGLKTASGENPMLLKGAELKRQAVSRVVLLLRGRARPCHLVKMRLCDGFWTWCCVSVLALPFSTTPLL